MPRKQKKYHYIYKTTNKLNGKYYYGMHSTDDLNDGYMGSGRRLRYSINKHGAENHEVEILEFCNDRKSLVKREEEIVTLNEIAKKDCMNLMVGGTGGFVSEEQQRNRSVCGGLASAKRRKEDPKLAKKLAKISSETFKKVHSDGKIKYDTFTGKKHSEESKKKMSKSMKGKGLGSKNSQFGTCWITKDGDNKKIKKKELESYIKLGWIRGRE